MGLKYGDWAVQKFGTGPTRVDALEFLLERLQNLHKECIQHRNDCLPPNELVMPAAFIIFQNRRAQVKILSLQMENASKFYAFQFLVILDCSTMNLSSKRCLKDLCIKMVSLCFLSSTGSIPWPPLQIFSDFQAPNLFNFVLKRTL